MSEEGGDLGLAEVAGMAGAVMANKADDLPTIDQLGPRAKSPNPGLIVDGLQQYRLMRHGRPPRLTPCSRAAATASQINARRYEKPRAPRCKQTCSWISGDTTAWREPKPPPTNVGRARGGVAPGARFGSPQGLCWIPTLQRRPATPTNGAARFVPARPSPPRSSPGA